MTLDANGKEAWESVAHNFEDGLKQGIARGQARPLAEAIRSGWLPPLAQTTDALTTLALALLEEPVSADHVHEYRLSYACVCGEHAQGETFETVRRRHARTARAPHQHEKWQLQESAKGGMYCAACGEDVPEENA